LDTWETFFAEKSRRRSRRRSRGAAMKFGVLILMFGSIATAIYLGAAGLTQ